MADGVDVPAEDKEGDEVGVEEYDTEGALDNDGVWVGEVDGPAPDPTETKHELLDNVEFCVTAI